MIQLNPRYEAIFNTDNIDQDCDGIASQMNVEADFIKEVLDAGLYKQAGDDVSPVAQVDDEAFCGG